MTTLARLLLDQHQQIVERWVERWRATFRHQAHLDQAVLENSLSAQLRVIGEQLDDLSHAESADGMLALTDRLDPESRLREGFSIDEVVQEYGLVAEVVRQWAEDHGVVVAPQEHRYFARAIVELIAESVRRYNAYQTHLIRTARADYLAAVMHQLRTPLTALALQVDLMSRAAPGPTPELVKLRRNIRRMHVLVEGVLRLERFEPSEVPQRPREVEAARMVSDLMADHEGDARRKRLRYEAHVDPALRLTVDPDLLTDALGNLIHNAVKYTAEGFVEVQAVEEGERVSFMVRDSGPGVPSELRDSIEERRSTPAGWGGSGMGLGLRIASHAAEALGGAIHISSSDAGSTFTLEVPRGPPERVRVAPSRSPRPSEAEQPSRH